VLFAALDGVEIARFSADNMDNPPLGPGIDIKARGGYIIAPTSRHISGRSYAWSVDHHPRNVALAPAPAWLIERLSKKSQNSSADNGSSIVPISPDKWGHMTRQPVTEYRDEVACSIAGHLFRHGCDYELAVGLLHAWNSAWCLPPLGYHELNKIIARIADKEADRIERELRL
jgi:hypothetical protein